MTTTNKNLFRTYKLADDCSTTKVNATVIQLRRNGHLAWVDNEYLHTTASVVDVAFASGNALQVISLNH